MTKGVNFILRYTQKQKNILEKAAEVIGDIIVFNADDGQDVTGSETMYEANLGFIKIRKTVKKGK